MKEAKAAFQTLFLKSLYDTVSDYMKKYNQGKNRNQGLSIGKIIEAEIKRMIEQNIPFPCNPTRRVTRHRKGGKYEIKRGTVNLRPSEIAYFNAVLSKRAQEQFKEKVEITSVTAYGNIALYLFSKRHGLPIKDESYFSDEGFRDTPAYERERALESLLEMQKLLGRKPTVREWNERKKEVRGLSYSKLVSMFGSYSKAWEEAENIK